MKGGGCQNDRVRLRGSVGFVDCVLVTRSNGKTLSQSRREIAW